MDPIPYDVCRSTNALTSLDALNGARLSSRTLGATPGELRVDGLSFATTIAPLAGICVGLLAWWWGATLARSAWQRAVRAGAVSAGALCIITLAGWGALHVADAWRADAHFDRAGVLLRLAVVIDPLLTRIGRADAPAEHLAELNQYEAIRTHLARAHVDSAVAAAEWPNAHRSAAAEARTIAWLALTQRQLDADELSAALAAAHAASGAAHAAQPAAPALLAEVDDALGLANARAAAAAVRELAPTTARRHVDAVAAGWRPALRATVDGATAIAEASALLADSLPEEAQLQQALGHLERAFTRDPDNAAAALRCAMADTRGALASVGLANGQDVVPILREAEQHVVGMARLEQLMDPALQLRGALQLQSGDGDGAVATLEEHWDRFAPPDAAAARQLAGAYALAATQAAERSDMHGAVDLIERAVTRMPGDEAMYRALGAARLARADAQLAAGNLEAGRQELVAVMDFPAERERAERKLHALTGATERLRRLRAVARWSPIPAIEGETWDLDTAGAPRRTYHANGRPVAYDSAGITVSFPGETPGSAIVVRDTNLDEAFDRVTIWTPAGDRREITDVDFDRRPDVIVDYDPSGRLRQRQPLSGSVQLWPRAGAIGILTDVPIGEHGEADAYVVLRRNGREIARTEVVRNRRFPRWQRALHVDVRWGDELGIEVRDRDLLFDDLVDVLTVRDFPRSAALVTERGAVALDLEVIEAPSVPEGMISIRQPPVLNPLQGRGQLPEVTSIVAQANAMDMNRELTRLVTRTVVVETLAWTLVKRGQVLRLGVALALDRVIPAGIP